MKVGDLVRYKGILGIVTAPCIKRWAKSGDVWRFKDARSYRPRPDRMFPELGGKTGLVLEQRISISGCPVVTVMLMGDDRQTFNESFFEVINHA